MRAASSIRAALIAALAVAAMGCGNKDVGYAVRLNLVIDDSITDAQKDHITTLELEVRASAEMWFARFPTGDRFSGRKAQIIYRPRVQSGTLPFYLRLRDAMDQLVGEGFAEVDLRPGVTVEATVNIAKPHVPDAGPQYDFLPGPDLAGIPDLWMPPPPDLARPPRDLTMPPPPPDLSMPPPPDDLSMPPPPDDLTTDDM